MKPERLFGAIVLFGTLSSLLLTAYGGVGKGTIFEKPLLGAGIANAIALLLVLGAFIVTEERGRNKGDNK